MKKKQVTVHKAMESPDLDYGSVVRKLAESVKRNLADGLLLSGGLDTAIIAYLASKWAKPRCITVALSGAPAPDIEYAKLVASRLKLWHYVHYFGNEELEEGIRATIRIMKSFDPMEIRNSAAVYIALKAGKDEGITTFMTGDGGDELFGGYSFLFGLSQEQLESALKKLSANMSFSSIHLAKDLGLEVRLPFLDAQFRAFATEIDAGLKIRSERGQVWGKWILRKAFEKIMPEELVWRVKEPIEVGTGTTILPSLIDSRISDLEFSEKKRRYLNEDSVVIRSKEHLFYYEIYRALIGVPHAADSTAKSCPDCGVNVPEGTSFCRTCGAYPI
ncbi:MAG: asparagine synthase [Chloroflexi bacterium]|nr:asparagine synthase [Chloroflexota bacterium]